MIQRKTTPRTSSSPEPINFQPDWSMLGTAERFEQELIGFKFKGPGWYLSKYERDGKTGIDTILVIPVGENGSIFRACVYNERNPIESFNWVHSAPVRVDERE
jgi:hypothetical protein